MGNEMFEGKVPRRGRIGGGDDFPLGHPLFYKLCSNPSPPLLHTQLKTTMLRIRET